MCDHLRCDAMAPNCTVDVPRLLVDVCVSRLEELLRCLDDGGRHYGAEFVFVSFWQAAGFQSSSLFSLRLVRA